jgi:hypothetical protein
MDQSLVTITIITTFVFWLIGISGNWRRTIIVFLLSYVAVILAFQHYDTIAGMIVDIFGLSRRQDQLIALGIEVCLLISLLGLYVLYSFLWKPSPASQNLPSGGIRLLQSIITALIGWSIGVLLAACYLQFTSNVVPISLGNDPTFSNAFRVTINIINNIVKPWLIFDPPSFMVVLGT